MQYGFPHFGDRHVAAVERGIHVVAQRPLGVGGRDAGQRDETPVASAEAGPLPHFGEDEVEQSRCRTA